MRRTRRIILILISLILGAVGVIYQTQKSTQARNAPSKPATLPETVSASANDWNWSETRNGVPIVEVNAKSFSQDTGANRLELEGVTLKIFDDQGKTYNKVQSAKADFDTENGLLTSEGEVEITMGIDADPAEAAKQAGRLIVIKTSGVRFESKTGKAWTEKAASFRFDRGEGQSVGAEYDPASRELHMRKDAQLTWYDSDRPMHIQAGALVYKEAESKVWLLEWSKFQRATLSMDAGPAIVSLEDGVIRHVEAANARGTDAQKDREVQYSANQLNLKFTDKGAVEDVVGSGDAKLVSTAPAAQTTVTSDRLDLDFAPGAGDSALTKATAVGKAIVESRPLPRPDTPIADTRILRSEVITMLMRDGGEDIEKVQAEAPGTIDFIPNRPGQKKRHLNGEGITIQYAGGNKIESFSAVSVRTLTESDPVKGKPQPPATTSSKGMSAKFEPNTGTLLKLEQWDNFQYQEGDRHAKADRALLEPAADRITLTGSARFWDPAGSTAANTILLSQKTGDVRAEGDVSSTRLPDNKPAQPQAGAMLSPKETLQAKAARMTTSDNNRQIRYEGNALMWQGSNRLEAGRIDIDRTSGRLEAEGAVFSQLLDRSATEKQKKLAVFTVVRAPYLLYQDKERIAHYKGGVKLTRGTMVVNSTELRAFLKAEEGGGSSLDHAFADGSVKIVDTGAGRARTGTSEHAEFYAADGKVLLHGGDPQLADTVKGTTKGRRLTYYTNLDKLIVEGGETQPIESRILKRK
jgi:lipopolysaccharide export system protein LptA